MDWYYASAGERIGPVDVARFRSLVADATITAETLVWNADLPDWKRWGDLEPPLSAADIALGRGRGPVRKSDGPQTMVCVECSGTFLEEDGIKINGGWVCAGCKPVAVLRFKQDSPVIGEVEYAGFAPRFYAKVIDSFIIGAVCTVPQWIFLILMGNSYTATPEFNPMIIFGSMAGGMLQLPITLAFQAYFLGRFGATPGKAMLGLRVVGADLEPISYARGLGRAAAELITGFTCSIGYLLCLYDAQRRNLHDYIAATRVIRESGDR